MHELYAQVRADLPAIARPWGWLARAAQNDRHRRRRRRCSGSLARYAGRSTRWSKRRCWGHKRRPIQRQETVGQGPTAATDKGRCSARRRCDPPPEYSKGAAKGDADSIGRPRPVRSRSATREPSSVTAAGELNANQKKQRLLLPAVQKVRELGHISSRTKEIAMWKRTSIALAGALGLALVAATIPPTAASASELTSTLSKLSCAPKNSQKPRSATRPTQRENRRVLMGWPPKWKPLPPRH